MQNPNVTFVATPSQWEKRFRRTVKPESRPLVILQPRGPVMFVFDLADTEGEPLPVPLQDPFAVAGVFTERLWRYTLINCPRDWVGVMEKPQSMLQGGSISPYIPQKHRHLVKDLNYPVRYILVLNEELDVSSRYATLVHELGHLYCGHLGGSKEGEWPERRNLNRGLEEIEAESISYLVCVRFGLATKSEAYLASYVEYHAEMPELSLDTILRVAGRIEEMGDRRLPPRKRKTTD